MFHKTDRQLNRKQLKAQLKSAVMDLTPNVLDKIDLTMPQMTAEELHEEARRAVRSIAVMRRRMRVMAALAQRVSAWWRPPEAHIRTATGKWIP